MTQGKAPVSPPPPAGPALVAAIRAWGRELGFQAVGIAGIELAADEARLLAWLEAGHHGEMSYMARHGTRRSRPAELVPGTLSVISARMDHLPPDAVPAAEVLGRGELGYVARYALGRDYHRLLRARLKALAGRVAAAVGPLGHRVFVDSAPVLERALARQAGLGWVGKHGNLLARKAGSWFLLGEIFTDLALPPDRPVAGHCGSCRACIQICPTRAIVAPYRLDARLCISYLTIELRGPIPPGLRPALGNRIFGCDDCQLACPWNRFARPTPETDFLPRHGLDAPRLVDLLGWSREQFERRTEGSPIRRLGHERWLRNVAVALGNGPSTLPALQALRRQLTHPAELVCEHVRWALDRLSQAPR
jgi:epoxyqueuosine reductase